VTIGAFCLIALTVMLFFKLNESLEDDDEGDDNNEEEVKEVDELVATLGSLTFKQFLLLVDEIPELLLSE
jgi:hypothetical protein